MKKLLFVAVILLFASACDNEDDTIIQLENSDLQGNWSRTSETDVENETWKVTYTFNLNGDFQTVSTYNEEETEAIIGYNHKTEGNYSFKQDSLILNTEKVFRISNDSETYVSDVSELEEFEVSQSNTMGYSLTENKTKLTLKFKPCKLNELCVGDAVLFKE